MPAPSIFSFTTNTMDEDLPNACGWFAIDGVEYFVHPQQGSCQTMGAYGFYAALSHSASVVKGFQTLSDDYKNIVLRHTYRQIQQAYDFQTTVCVTLSWLDANRQLYTWNFNVGDSNAYLVVLGKHRNVIKRLNNPPTADESGFKISQRSVHLKKSKHAFIVTASASLTENNLLSESRILKTINKHFKAKNALHTMAANLTAIAVQRKSTDNIAVSVAPVGVAVAVFDGRSSDEGDVDALDMSHCFFSLLGKNIRRVQPAPMTIQSESKAEAALLDTADKPRHDGSSDEARTPAPLTTPLMTGVTTRVPTPAPTSAPTSAIAPPNWVDEVNALLQPEQQTLDLSKLAFLRENRDILVKTFIKLARAKESCEQFDLVSRVLEQKNSLGVILNMEPRRLVGSFINQTSYGSTIASDSAEQKSPSGSFLSGSMQGLWETFSTPKYNGKTISHDLEQIRRAFAELLTNYNKQTELTSLRRNPYGELLKYMKP